MERLGTVLLVEDEHVLRGLVAQFLRGAGFRVVEAADGPQAVERFASSGPFELVLLDLNLPGFFGDEVCRQIRLARPDQPVIICSAAITPELEDALRDLGVTHFLTKPYHPEALLAHIGHELGRPCGLTRARLAPASRTLDSSEPSPMLVNRGRFH